MTKNKSLLYIFLILVSLLAIALGALIQSEAQKALSGILFGAGAGLFGFSVAKVVTLWIESSNPAYKRKVDIEANDERNQTINNIARGKAFNALSPIFGSLILVFVLMDVQLLPILLLIGAYLAVYVVYFYQLNKLGKEM